MNVKKITVLESDDFVVVRNPKNIFDVIENGREFKLRVEHGDWIPVYSGTYEQCLQYKTKGQIYRERTGHSKSMRRNMLRKGIHPDTPGAIESYRHTRVDWKKARRKAMVDKRFKARAGQKAKTVTIKKK